MEAPAVSKRVLVLGGSGTIGRATVSALTDAGHDTVCLLRPGSDYEPKRASTVFAEATDPAAVAKVIAADRFDAIVSTLASRTGSPRDAWAVDHDVHLHVLDAAKEGGVGHFVQLSAICVQKPLLEFQKAKLAFENALMASGLAYSIVRATAFFKSLSGQVERVRAGKPFLVFGDGMLTACKPISDRDLAAYIVGCLEDPQRMNRVLPIGGPGPAITPLDQVAMLSELLGQKLRVRHVPVALMDTIIAASSVLGRVYPNMAEKAEFARIGRYYGTESMLVFDADSGTYSPEKTPETGSDTLRKHYERLLRGEVAAGLGDHAVF